jgi:2-dehydro-3-deoxygluconokinase
MRTGGLITVGETMGLLSSTSVGLLRTAGSLALGVGGAESNVAIGVARLGGQATWIGRVGDDPIGDLVVSRLAGEGVDTTLVVRDDTAPTSLMLKEQRTPDLSRVVYYRRNGPGSRLRPQDLDEERIAAAQVLHVTGITPALSSSAARTVTTAIAMARDADVTVSLDINYRAALWSPEEARPVLLELVKTADIVFAGDDEAALLGVHGDPPDQAAALAELGPSRVVIKLGARGAVACLDGHAVEVAAHQVSAVDPVGAGDAFVAGFLAEGMAGACGQDALRVGAACGAFVVQVPGDWEGLPTRAELAHLGATPGTVLR